MQGCFWYVPHLGREMGPALPEEGEMGLLSLGSHHNDAAGVHLAPVCSRKLEGNCGNCYLHGRSNKQVGKRWENSGTGLGWCSRIHEHGVSFCGARWLWKMLLLSSHCCMDYESPTPSERRSSPLQLHPTMCAAGSTIPAQERLRMEMCCIRNPLLPSAEGL